MAKPRKSLVKPRSHAFLKQNGLCFYCEQPMWVKDPSELSSKYDISLGKIKRLKCTGEHLVAFKDGGVSKKNNIVAACLYCNKQRHRRKTSPTPLQFGKMVQYRLSRGRWHGLTLVTS